MKLPAEITIQIPDSDKTLKISELPITLIDSTQHRTVHAHINIFPFFKTLVLWQNEEYDNVGDYTQAQAETRILELLGDDIGQGLLQLYMPTHTK